MKIKRWYREQQVNSLNRHLKKKGVDISRLRNPLINILTGKNNKEAKAYIRRIGGAALYLNKNEVDIVTVILNSPPCCINNPKTAEEFGRWMIHLHKWASENYDKNMTLPRKMARAFEDVPKAVRETPDFDEYLKIYQRYLNSISLLEPQPSNDPKQFRKFKDNTLDEICFGIDCIDIAIDVGIYSWGERPTYTDPDFPIYCINPANPEGYQERFKVVAKNSGKVEPKIRLIGAPVIANFADNKADAEKAYKLLSDKIFSLEFVHPIQIMQLSKIVTDYEGFEKCIDALACYLEPIQKNERRRAYLKSRPDLWKNTSEYNIYTKLLTISENASEFLDNVDAYVRLRQQLESKDDYRFVSDKINFWHLFPRAKDAIKTNGDFDLHLVVEKHEESTLEDLGGAQLSRVPYWVIDKLEAAIIPKPLEKST